MGVSVHCLAVFLAAMLAFAGVAIAQDSPYSAREIQQALVNRGHDPGAVDGVWGKRSTKALKAFQKAEGLPQSGALDKPTAEKLFPLRAVIRERLLKTPEKDVASPAVGDDVAIQPFPFLNEESGAAVTLLRLAITGVGDCKLPALDSAGIRKTLRRQIGSADLGLVEMRIGAAGTAADDSFLPAPARFSARPCEDWSALAKARGFLPAPPADAIVEGGARQPEPVSVEGKTSDDATPPAVSGAASGTLSPLIYLVLPVFAIVLFLRRRRRRKSMPAKESAVAVVADTGAERTAGPWSEASPTVVLEVKTRTVDVPSSSRRTTLASEAAAPSASTGWVPAHTPVVIGSHRIARGMIYVGGYLPRRDGSRENENCLIDPALPVAARGDPGGESMGYWPSYSRISPAARKTYLDWLAGPRSDPKTPIGYVFLYLYGLERRLMLEEKAADAPAVAAEVRRLLAIHGRNGSMRRYAGELLSAYRAKAMDFPDGFIPEGDSEGYEVPLSLTVAFGIRMDRHQPVEPDLLLAYVMAHPETRIRTPARRARGMLKVLFADAVREQYPKGLIVSGARVRRLKARYRAASGTFEVEVLPAGGTLPDITQLSEPLATGQRILDVCTDRLDAYSRELGRTEGSAPTLAAIAKLPTGYRRKEAEALAGRPLDAIEKLAAAGTVVTVRQLLSQAGLDAGDVPGRARLKEFSGTLAAFGYGNTADPAFSLKTAKPEDRVAVFRLEGEVTEVLAPGEHYRAMQLSIMLGLTVALADGEMHALEQDRLGEMIAAAPGLSGNERARLKAELVVQQADSQRLADWAKRIKDAPEASRRQLADALVGMATADGALDAREVSHLEKLFKPMGMEGDALYSRLHGGLAAGERDEDLAIVIPAENDRGVPIPQKSRASRVDLGRLDAIRHETRTTASVLAEIFSDEEETVVEPAPPVREADVLSDGFDGLERRYGALVSELRERAEWPAAEFDRLVREAGLMPGAARETLNDWSLDRFDELLLEGEDPIQVNTHVLPPPILPARVERVEA